MTGHCELFAVDRDGYHSATTRVLEDLRDIDPITEFECNHSCDLHRGKSDRVRTTLEETVTVY